MSKKIVLALLLSVCGVTIGFAQQDYKPEVYGLVRAKYEVSAYDGQSRFDIRNARIGIRGLAAPNFNYAVQIDANTQGGLSLIDAYAGYRLGDLRITLGQQSHHLNMEYSRGSGRNYFSNHSFLGSYLTRSFSNVDNNPQVRDIGSSDMGALLRYKYESDIPVEVMLGLFKGSGMINPQWGRGANLLGRIIVGGEEGLAGSAGYYGGASMLSSRMDVWSAGARYRKGGFYAEAEYGQRTQKTGENSDDVMRLAVVYALYRFPLFTPLAKSISPILRYDYGENIKFINNSGKLEGFDAQRITGGITIGLSERELKSEIRFSYEHFLMKNKTSDYKENPMLQNKFVVEFFVAF